MPSATTERRRGARRPRRRLAGATTILALGWVACGDLGEIDEGRCGNEVVEAGEDCDTYADLPGAEVCVGLGLPGQCRYSCAPKGESDAERFSCPVGWGCGSDGICRRPAGRLGTLLETGRPMGRWFDVADFDGDGELDVASVSDATLAVNYLERGAVRDGFETPFEAVGLPTTADADADGRADLLLPSSKGLALFRGTRERRLAPTAFASLRVRLPQSFLFAAMDVVPEVVDAGDGTLLRFPGDEPLTFAGGFTFAVANLFLGVNPNSPNASPIVLDSQAQPPGARPVVATFDEVADTHGPFHESPEQLAVVQGDEVIVLRPSYALNDVFGSAVVFWMDAPFEFDPQTVPLAAPPPSHPSRSILTRPGATVQRIATSQVNGIGAGGRSRIPCGGATFAPGDSHVDLVVEGIESGAPRTWVAFGLGDGTFHSDPCALEAVAAATVAADSSFAVPANMAGCGDPILALADIDGDGAADAVTATHTHLSGLTPAGQEEAVDLCDPSLEAAHPDGIVFAAAVTGDVDGDGIVDVLAAHTEPGLTVLSTNGEAKLRRTSRVSEAPVETLRVGDFDGDGVQDVAFSEARDTDRTVSVLFGEARGALGPAVEVATFPALLEMVAADIARSGERDAPQELIFATPEPSTDMGFRYGIIDGSADRLLQAPFVYATENAVQGQSPDYVPVGAAIADFDVTCGDEVADDPNPQVLFVTGGRSEGFFPMQDTPVSALGAACVDASARFSVAEDVVSDLGLSAAEEVQGTAVIAADLDGETRPLVATFNPVEGNRRITVALATATEGDDGLRWSTGESISIEGATVAGSPATVEAAPSSPLRAWSPLLNNVPSSCRLWPQAPPAVVFLAVHDDGSCPEGSGARDRPARTVLHVVPGTSVPAIGEGILEGALELSSDDDDAPILAFACLDLDDDPEDEIVVLRARGAIDQCNGSPSGPFSAEVRAVDASLPGQLVLAGVMGELSPELLTQRPGLPPVGGIRAGDFDRDGVDDLFVGTPERSFVWLGRAVLP